MAKKKIVPVGSLVQEPVHEEAHNDIIEWLNKDRSSSVFVSFGSECFLSKEDMVEIAHGLELSKVDFIWVVRLPLGKEVKLQGFLPTEYFEKIKRRGRIVEGWAPQGRILEHPSIGGFVSHCGWGSLMEGLKFGVPIIGMPMHLDQPFNARLANEIGLAIEVRRDEEGRLEREEIARVVKEVVIERGGASVRRKVKELSEAMGNKGEEEMDWVAEELGKLCMKHRV